MSSNTSQCSADRRKALLAELSRGEVEAILSRKGLPSFTRKTLNSLDALVSDLEAARAHGWSLDDEERTLGMRCLATAIFNEHREAVARVSISGPAAGSVAGRTRRPGAQGGRRDHREGWRRPAR